MEFWFDGDTDFDYYIAREWGGVYQVLDIAQGKKLLGDKSIECLENSSVSRSQPVIQTRRIEQSLDLLISQKPR